VTQQVTPSIVVVRQPPTKVTFSLTAAAVTTVTTEALLSMVSVRGVTAAGAATSQTVTTGKTLRITSITIAVVASGAAAIVQGNAILRARASGSLVTTDPALWRGRVSSNSTVQQSAGWMSATFPDGLDLPSGTVFGFSTIASVTTGAWDISLNGYEF